MNRHTDNLLDILASSALGKDFLRAEEAFRNLPLKEKVRMVMSYEPRTFQVETTTRCIILRQRLLLESIVPVSSFCALRVGR